MSEQFTTDKITTERVGRILVIGFHRPDTRNRMDTEMIRGLAEAYTLLENDSELWCGLVFAHGDEFTFGLDLGEVAQSILNGGLAGLMGEGNVDPWGMATKRCSKPIVVAVHGRCFTAGLELSLAADVIIAADNTVFGQMEVSRGIFALGGATVRMPEVFGWHAAMRYMLTGDTFDAAEGHRLGLVSEIVPLGTQKERAIEMAEKICRSAPLAVQATIANALTGRDEGREAAAQQIQPEIMRLLASEDAQEGVASLMERRPARFQGK